MQALVWSLNMYSWAGCLSLAVPLYIEQQNVIVRGIAEEPVMEKHSFKFETKTPHFDSKD